MTNILLTALLAIVLPLLYGLGVVAVFMGLLKLYEKLTNWRDNR